MKIVNPLKQLPGALNFLREVKTEGMRVNWPTREKTIKDTLIVIGFAVAIAVFLSVSDYIFQSVLDRFLL
ncbi:MAG: preprotein translocase subunit SecE [Candidatus Wildermuthbacteria bacterium RIFCSPLOWO2_01_FULL_48_29]|uniref:Protein translocase subunit SecE n=2 Tax=Candidatus Wildermuthiibacteriota TaxID=1817923 RepID=A0A1G2RLD0_9BACT|nr:MAG: preprotein translocase subunit SecE [Candidatus Wildermuthbacteria bacterium RIFCSPHIGHO2_01_FULL_48_27b]OHA73298.1 MAG: preprotein translocase subunit SecE [Candidatus Wildermuthbacteria bacterium RIFCSPLOWO2_01_FULL_48_29]